MARTGRPKETIHQKMAKRSVEMNMDNVSTLYKSGFTDEAVAKFFDITVRALHDWKKREDFSSPLKDWKDEADAEVEKAMYQNAKGFRTTYKKNIVVSDGAQQGSHVELVEEEVVYPPNSTAGIFWLKNRKPDKWRDRNQNMNLNGTIDDEKFCDEFFNMPDKDK